MSKSSSRKQRESFDSCEGRALGSNAAYGYTEIIEKFGIKRDTTNEVKKSDKNFLNTLKNIFKKG